MHAPDLFDGETFGSIEGGVRLPALAGRGRDGRASGRGRVRTTRAVGVRRLLLGCPARSDACPEPTWRQGRPALRVLHPHHRSRRFGSWPSGVPVQIHGAAGDEFFQEDLPAAEALVRTVGSDGAALFTYPGDHHLFADRSLPSHDPKSADRLTQTLTGVPRPRGCSRAGSEVDPDSRDAVVAAMQDLVGRARAADGCLDLAITADPLDPVRINNHERWESQDALDNWRATGATPGMGTGIRNDHVMLYDVPDRSGQREDTLGVAGADAEDRLAAVAFAVEFGPLNVSCSTKPSSSTSISTPCTGGSTSGRKTSGAPSNRNATSSCDGIGPRKTSPETGIVIDATPPVADVVDESFVIREIEGGDEERRRARPTAAGSGPAVGRFRNSDGSRSDPGDPGPTIWEADDLHKRILKRGRDRLGHTSRGLCVQLRARGLPRPPSGLAVVTRRRHRRSLREAGLRVRCDGRTPQSCAAVSSAG